MKIVIERNKNGDRCWDFLLLPHGFGGFERVKMFFMFLLSVSGIRSPLRRRCTGLLTQSSRPGLMYIING